MTTDKAEKFVDLVRRSGLVEEERLNAALSGINDLTSSDSGIVCSTLIKAGLLTEWQTTRLLEGRHRGFFLGRYKLLDHLGTGGMSAVYLAEHCVLQQLVAVKVLPQVRVNDSSYLARFYREARAGAALNNRNIVRTFDADHDGNVHYLVMEYVNGADVQQLVKRDGPLDFRRAADFTRQAADGLFHAHNAGMIHRDIKPSNLLVDHEDIVKILDLGLARVSEDEVTSLTILNDEKVLGTVDYLAPEQAVHSHRIDARADQYSLGCTLYFMLTGKPPFPEGSMPQRVLMHQTAEPAPITNVRKDAPPSLVAICKRLMAKKPEDRFATAKDVSQALTDWLEGKDPAGSGIQRVYEDHDLSLAPLDDEAHRPKPASSAPAAGSGVLRPTAPSQSGANKTVPGGSGRLQQPGSGVQSGSGVKPGSGRIQQPGSGVNPGSGVKPGSGKIQQPASGSGARKVLPGASGGMPVAKPVGEQPAGASPSASGGMRAVTPAAPAQPPPPVNPAESLLDEMLGPAATDLSSLDSLTEGPALTNVPGPVVGRPGASKQRRGPSLWDHTWFVIMIGLGLGGLVVLIGVLIAYIF